MHIGRVLTVWIGVGALAQADVLTLGREQRPAWLSRDGIVMAGSWEPLYFRVRRDGASDYTPTAAQRAAYEREHSPAMVARLKALGVNFVMLHCQKGGGLEWERESMADAVRFAKLCREHGLRTGAYVSSSGLLWDVFFKEVPAARDWVILEADGQPRIQSPKATYRHFFNRNHPDAAAYYRRVVEFAVNDMQLDLVHWDNYARGRPGHDAYSLQQFRRYLGDTFTAEERASMGAGELAEVRPPDEHSSRMLNYAWQEFSCRSLIDAFGTLNRWVRALQPHVLVECNPGGPHNWINPPIDHGRLLLKGDAFWDEGPRPAFEDGKLRTRITTYKLARRLDNMAFTYTRTPLEIAESLAFNLDCLGCVCWFEYGELYDHPSAKAMMSRDLEPYIRFFHQRRALLRDARVIADAAVLRSFPSQVFGGADFARLTLQAEQALIAGRTGFQIIYDPQLGELHRYRTLVLAGCVAMSDEQAGRVRRYVQQGGRLCVIGPLATHDAWNRPRAKPALADLPASRVLHLSAKDDLPAAVRRACDDAPAVAVDGPHGLCSEFTEQPGRRMVHLVNYRGDAARTVHVQVRLPTGRRARSVTLVGPEHTTDRALPFQVQGGAVSFTVPEIRVYEIAVVELE